MKPGKLPFRGFLDRTPAAYVVLLGTLLLTVLAWYYVEQNVENRERAWFDETVVMTEEAIDQRMGAYVDAMLDSRGLFYASSSVGQDEWRDYVAGSNLTSRYPGIQVLSYIERVRPGGYRPPSVVAGRPRRSPRARRARTQQRAFLRGRSRSRVWPFSCVYSPSWRELRSSRGLTSLFPESLHSQSW